MSDNFVPVYPFDPTGKATTNLVIGEQQILTEANGADYHLIVPKFAPYFVDSLVITLKTPNSELKTLVNGVDYLCSHWFIAASRSVAKPVYGSISIVDSKLAGVVTMQYQTLGGIWSMNADNITTILSDKVHNPRVTSWDEVIDKPILFPVIDHEWDITDLFGVSKLVESINSVEQAIVNKVSTGLPIHISDYGNPHNVTAAQLNCYTKDEITLLLKQQLNTITLQYQRAIQDAISKYINP